MDNKFDFDIIRRYCEGNFDKEDIQYIYSLFSDYENDIGFQKYIKGEFLNYINTEPAEEVNISNLLGIIHGVINKNESRKKQAHLKCIYKWYSAVAAILLLPVIIAGYIWFDTVNKSKNVVLVAEEESVTLTTIHAPLGSRISFTLPDSTVGWLSGGSYLTYGIPFANNRNVNISGEVWFDVNKNEQYPFKVYSGTSLIEVTGTKFNLSAYPEEDYVEVILEEGGVIFSQQGLVSQVEMKPNERLLLKNGNIDISSDVDVSKYTGWKEGKLIFRSDSMSEVAKRIERWYNVKVVLVDKELDDYVIRGTFQDDSLEEVFHFLSMLVPLEYQVINQSIDKDGSVQNKKILLKHKT